MVSPLQPQSRFSLAQRKSKSGTPRARVTSPGSVTLSSPSGSTKVFS